MLFFSRPIGAVVLFLAALAAPGLRAQNAVPQILLIQNSGWMLPFYEDPNSKFKDVVQELSNRLAPYGGEQLVASFNQSIGDNKSPLLHYRGADAAKIRSAVQALAVARKPGKQTYADTDFKEAIVGAISEFSPGKSTLLWIVTNNKNSPNNSAETVQKNKDFYKFLQDTPEIRRIVAFPHALPAQSKTMADYRANGLMFYALAYGDPADQVLQKMLAANAPFGKQAARLKPLNAEALTFIPKGVKNSDVAVRLAPDHKTLVLTFAAASKPEVAELVGQFRNDFYPYDIQSAKVEIDTQGLGTKGKEKISVDLSNKQVSQIPAGGLSPELSVKIKVPALPSPWDPEVIFGNGYRASGVIRFELDEQQLTISKDFSKAMAELFPKDPLPDLFIPGDSAKKSVTTQALVIDVQYPSWPLLVLGGLALALLGGLVGAFMLFRSERIFRVSIDGAQKTFGLRPFAEAVIKNAQGERVGVLKRAMGQATAVLDKGKTCVVRVM